MAPESKPQSKVIWDLEHKDATSLSEKAEEYLREFAEDLDRCNVGRKVLTEADKLSRSLQEKLSLKGELAELAFGTFDQQTLWKHREELVKDGGILEGYKALNGAELVAHFKGPQTGAQVVFTYDKAHEELTVAFSGTSTFTQIRHDMDADPTSLRREKKKNSLKELHPSKKEEKSLHALLPSNIPIDSPEKTAATKEVSTEVLKEQVQLSTTPDVDATVHRGFLTVYSDLEQDLIDKLFETFSSGRSIKTLSIVGHSLGAALGFFLVMMLLEIKLKQTTRRGDELTLPDGVRLKVYAFGCPRVGSLATRKYYLGLVEGFRDRRGDKGVYEEYSVRLYMDWAVYLTTDDYVHLAENPIYEFNGSLYAIDPKDFDCTRFAVEYPDENKIPTPKFPRGGHMFYNDREFWAMKGMMENYMKQKKEDEKKKRKQSTGSAKL